MAGQMLRRSGPAAAPADAGGSTVSPSEAMSATGTTTSTSSSLAGAGVHHGDGSRYRRPAGRQR